MPSSGFVPAQPCYCVGHVVDAFVVVAASGLAARGARAAIVEGTSRLLLAILLTIHSATIMQVDLLYAAAAAVWKARRNNDLLNLFCVSRVWVCIGVGVRDNYTPECVPPLANKRVCGLCIVRSVELRDREGGAGRRHKDGDGGPKSHARRPTTTNARECVYSLARTYVAVEREREIF